MSDDEEEEKEDLSDEDTVGNLFSISNSAQCS